MGEVRCKHDLSLLALEWYDIDNMSRLYTCTAARVGYIIALLPFGPHELEMSTSLAILSSTGTGEAATLSATVGERGVLVSTHWAGCTSVVHRCTGRERSPLGIIVGRDRR